MTRIWRFIVQGAGQQSRWTHPTSAAMTKPTAKAISLSPTGSLLTAVSAGLLLGRVVMGLSARHHGSTAGLVVSMIFLIAATASVTLFLTHAHAQRRSAQPAPIQTWLVAL